MAGLAAASELIRLHAYSHPHLAGADIRPQSRLVLMLSGVGTWSSARRHNAPGGSITLLSRPQGGRRRVSMRPAAAVLLPDGGAGPTSLLLGSQFSQGALLGLALGVTALQLREAAGRLKLKWAKPTTDIDDDGISGTSGSGQTGLATQRSTAVEGAAAATSAATAAAAAVVVHAEEPQGSSSRQAVWEQVWQPLETSLAAAAMPGASEGAPTPSPQEHGPQSAARGLVQQPPSAPMRKRPALMLQGLAPGAREELLTLSLSALEATTQSLAEQQAQQAQQALRRGGEQQAQQALRGGGEQQAEAEGAGGSQQRWSWRIAGAASPASSSSSDRNSSTDSNGSNSTVLGGAGGAAAGQVLAAAVLASSSAAAARAWLGYVPYQLAEQAALALRQCGAPAAAAALGPPGDKAGSPSSSLPPSSSSSAAAAATTTAAAVGVFVPARSSRDGVAAGGGAVAEQQLTLWGMADDKLTMYGGALAALGLMAASPQPDAGQPAAAAVSLSGAAAAARQVQMSDATAAATGMAAATAAARAPGEGEPAAASTALERQQRREVGDGGDNSGGGVASSAREAAQLRLQARPAGVRGWRSIGTGLQGSGGGGRPGGGGSAAPSTAAVAAVLQDMAVVAAEAVAAAYLAEARDGIAGVPGGVGTSQQAAAAAAGGWPTYVLPGLQTTRNLEHFRNQVAMSSWLHRNVDSVAAMYEDRQPLWAMGPGGALRRRAIRVKRTQELEALRGWKLALSLSLEAVDLAAPLLRSLLLRARALLSWLLVGLIGQSLGLVYRGIRQSMTGGTGGGKGTKQAKAAAAAKEAKETAKENRVRQQQQQGGGRRPEGEGGGVQRGQGGGGGGMELGWI